MSDAISEFFDGLGSRGHEPSLERASGTIRFDITDHGRTDHWNVTMTKGALRVSRGKGSADCVLSGEKQVFEGLISGELNTLTSLLRGTLAMEGDPQVAIHFRQLRQLLLEMPS
jgi:putative sterol carrier protein